MESETKTCPVSASQTLNACTRRVVGGGMRGHRNEVGGFERDLQNVYSSFKVSETGGSETRRVVDMKRKFPGNVGVAFWSLRDGLLRNSCCALLGLRSFVFFGRRFGSTFLGDEFFEFLQTFLFLSKYVFHFHVFVDQRVQFLLPIPKKTTGFFRYLQCVKVLLVLN